MTPIIHGSKSTSVPMKNECTKGFAQDCQCNQNQFPKPIIPSVPIWCSNPIEIPICRQGIMQDQATIFNPGMHHNMLINPQFGGIQHLPTCTVPSNFTSYKNNYPTGRANKLEKASSKKDVKKFKINSINQEGKEFLDMYQFACIENTKNGLHLAINIAEYSQLRGEELRTFNQQVEDIFSINSNSKYSIKHERLNYQKRVSKKKNKYRWASCARNYK